MKKSIFVIAPLLLISAFVHAQWTNTTPNISNTNTGSVTIGSTNPYTINAAASLFPSVTPRVEIFGTGSAASPFSDILSIRHSGMTADAVLRQVGVVLKISSESSTYESDKMGGLLLESANAYANYPTMSLVTANIRRLTIDQNGNIGINTTDTKGYKFGVNGSMIANSIVVKVYPWSDYVFKPDYQLRSLAEVKAYIDKNQHLPEIPSAQEVANNGINLGEMNSLLLKKVEELTLYLIEKDKTEKEQQVKIESQERRIKRLEQVLLQLQPQPKN